MRSVGGGGGRSRCGRRKRGKKQSAEDMGEWHALPPGFFHFVVLKTATYLWLVWTFVWVLFSGAIG